MGSKRPDSTPGSSTTDQAAEQLLVRTLLRVCVSAKGLSPDLDPYLDSLRSLLRKGYTPAAGPRLQALCGEFLALDDLQRIPTLLDRLLVWRGRGKDAVAQAAALWGRLATDPAAASDHDLDHLAELLGIRFEPDADADGELSEGSGLFVRLLNRAPAGSRVNRTLAALLQRLHWPDALRAQIDGYVERLEGAEQDDAWTQVVEQLGRRLVEHLEQAQAEVTQTGRFLSELTERLEVLDRLVGSDAERHAAADASGARLGESLRAEVGGIADQFRAGADLGQLRRSVLNGLERIQSHVDQHLAEQAARQRETEAQTESLRATMSGLEHEAYDLRRQLAESSQRALHDVLTGLPNRAAYEERVEQEFARWRRFGDEPLVLMLWDVDDFKRINDRYGHKAGDKALRLIARVLRERLRKSDFIARYGGEEFVALLIGADREGGAAVAEQMRSAVEGTALHSRKQPVPVTVSAGFSLFTEGDTPERVFERADQALYRAKREGKNRCVFA